MWDTTRAVRSTLVAVTLGAAFFLNGAVLAQSDVEAWFDRLIEAYGTADVEWIAEHDILSVAGYGFTAADWRDPLSSDADSYGIQNLRRFFEQMEYYRIELEHLDFKDEEGVVVAWGTHIEDFQIRGQAPEIVRVRFTTVLRRTPGGLRQLTYHRDVQPFNDQGRYVPDLARTPSGR